MKWFFNDLVTRIGRIQNKPVAITQRDVTVTCYLKYTEKILSSITSCNKNK